VTGVDGVATVTIDEAPRRNALTGELSRALVAQIELASADDAVGAIMITGAGPAFCAGADRALLARAGDAADDAARADLEAIYELFLALGTAPVPTVAAVNGAAVGAGLNLALSADLCVVAADAHLRSGFLGIGLHPGGGHHWLLRRRAGVGAANAMALFDLEISGVRAVELGLAWEAVPAAEVLRRAHELAAVPAAHPELARLITRTLRRASGQADWRQQVEVERGAQLSSLLSRSERAM
jgi:enoyl-CoA hydratase